jgi:hypothetical protein
LKSAKVASIEITHVGDSRLHAVIDKAVDSRFYQGMVKDGDSRFYKGKG